MDSRKILAQLNIIAQCRCYGIPLWQCPQLIFLIMGIIIIITAVGSFLIGTLFIGNPEFVALITLGLTFVLFVLASLISQSFDRLAEANRMKSEFINIVSHQLRSPLTNLRWTIDILMSKKTKKTKKQEEEYLETLQKNSLRMIELVNDLLTVSRIQEGTLPLKKEEFHLEDVAKELAQRCRPFAEASEMEIDLRFEQNLPALIGDPLRIKSVVENLLNNAIRYAFEEEKDHRKEKKKIEIIIKKRGAKNLYFEIKDNGIGIPKEDQKHIFRKFFRARNVLNRKAKGSGLGLYIAKSIIEKSKGKIGFLSEENKGTTFWFTLPLKS